MLKPQTAIYYCWSDIKDDLCSMLGRDINDYESKCEPGLSLAKSYKTPYHNFWHWWIDKVLCGRVYSGLNSDICLIEIVDNNEDAPMWVIEVLAAMLDLFGEKSYGDITIRYVW